VLTGDNDLVTRKVCTEVGIKAEKIVLGSQVETMTDPNWLRRWRAQTSLPPLPGSQAAPRSGHAAQGPRGRFMGDGINDAPPCAGRRRPLGG